MSRRPPSRPAPARPSSKGLQLADAEHIAAELARRLEFDLGGRAPRRLRVLIVGSVRRRAPRNKDLDLLVVVPPSLELRFGDVLPGARLGPRRAGDRVADAVVRSGGARRQALTARMRPRAGGRATKVRVDLFATTRAELPFALFHHTGDGAYNIRTRAHAKARGWRLNQYGVFVAGTDRRARGSAAICTERELAAFLGVTYRSPAQRSGVWIGKGR